MPSARRSAFGAMTKFASFSNANAAVLAAALASLPDADHVARMRKALNDARRWLSGEMARQGRRTIPSEANFLMVDVGGTSRRHRGVPEPEHPRRPEVSLAPELAPDHRRKARRDAGVRGGARRDRAGEGGRLERYGGLRQSRVPSGVRHPAGRNRWSRARCPPGPDLPEAGLGIGRLGVLLLEPERTPRPKSDQPFSGSARGPPCRPFPPRRTFCGGEARTEGVPRRLHPVGGLVCTQAVLDPDGLAQVLFRFREAVAFRRHLAVEEVRCDGQEVHRLVVPELVALRHRGCRSPEGFAFPPGFVRSPERRERHGPGEAPERPRERQLLSRLGLTQDLLPRPKRMSASGMKTM